MELDERKRKILGSIVEAHIRTGEPVSSKAVMERLGFSVSSATIRNEMANLFDRGLLEQPHTSAGRVPSHLGYRFYIDELLQCQPLTQQERDEIDALFNVRNPDPDQLLEDAAQVLADSTRCAAVSYTVTPNTVKVRRIEIIPVSHHTVMILVMASNGVIRSKLCRVEFLVSQKICEFFTTFSNSRLDGRSVEQVTMEYMNSVAVALDEYSRAFAPVLIGIYELCKQINDGQFYYAGTNNLLAYQEFRPRGYELLNLLEHRDAMMHILAGHQKGTRVTIGKENQDQELVQSAVLVANYPIGQRGQGAIGIIGPVRMNYAKVIPRVEYFAQLLSKMLSDSYEEQ